MRQMPNRCDTFNYKYSVFFSGFLFIYPTEYSFTLLESIINFQKSNWNDQAGFNTCLRHHKTNVRWTTLDAMLFPNGLILDNVHYEKNFKSKSIKPFMLHFNWMSGHKNENKRNLMKRYNVLTNDSKTDC